MAEDKKFPLGHTTLYFKDWYKVSGNIYDDLRKVLAADGYDTEHFSDDDCIFCILSQIDNCREVIRKNYNPVGLSDFFNQVMFSRYHTDEEKTVNEAILCYIRKVLCFLSVECFKKVDPDYSVLPKSFTYTPEKLAENMCYILTCAQDYENLDWRQFVIDECKKDRSWVGDYKDEEDVANQVLPILRKMFEDKKAENEKYEV